jgi:hypothetical protein
LKRPDGIGCAAELNRRTDGIGCGHPCEGGRVGMRQLCAQVLIAAILLPVIRAD